MTLPLPVFHTVLLVQRHNKPNERWEDLNLGTMEVNLMQFHTWELICLPPRAVRAKLCWCQWEATRWWMFALAPGECQVHSVNKASPKKMHLPQHGESRAECLLCKKWQDLLSPSPWWQQNIYKLPIMTLKWRVLLWGEASWKPWECEQRRVAEPGRDEVWSGKTSAW